MAYPTDINRNVLLCVEESRSEIRNSSVFWYLHGWNFDGHSGFGGQFELDGYEGEVVIVTKASNSIKCFYIDRHHSSSKSWGWWTETEELPEPPFLITNKLNTKLIFDGEFEMEVNKEGEKIFFGEIDPKWIGHPMEYLVLGSNGWFGKITQVEGTYSFHLLAYSDSIEKESILNSEMIGNYDVANAMDELMKDEELNVERFRPFGKVTRLLSQPEMSLSSV